jgi:RNA polymerase sigma-70 factor (ECF subfamily)
MEGDSFPLLLRQSREGDPAALGRLLDRFRHRLEQMATQKLRSFVRPKFGVSDLVQDTLHEAFRKFETFQGMSDAEFRQWLTKILLSRYRDAMRRFASNKRNVAKEVHFSAAIPSGVIVDQATTPATAAEHAETLELLGFAISALPKKYRTAIELRLNERLTFAEVGRRMGCSADAARMIWGRAIKELCLDLGCIDD